MDISTLVNLSRTSAGSAWLCYELSALDSVWLSVHQKIGNLVQVWDKKTPFFNTNRVLSPVLTSKRKERICCSILSYFPLKPANMVFSALIHQLIQTLYFVPIRLPPRQWSSSWRWVRESLFIHNTSLCSVNKRCCFFCLSSFYSAIMRIVACP